MNTRWSFHKFLSLVLLIVLAMALTACASRATAPTTPPPTSTSEPTDTPEPTTQTPSISVSPVEGGPGTLVTVAGSGWQSGGMLFIYLQDPALASDEPSNLSMAQVAASVDADGRFIAAFTFPADERWAQLPSVLITAIATTTGESASIGFRIASATSTPIPSDTVTATHTATLSPGADCTDHASFVSDVTIPDRTNLAPGAAFIKTWRLRNSGTCTWDNSYSIVFAGGDRMGGSSEVPLPATVQPGGVIDLSISLTAPAGNGVYRGNWQLRNDKGVLFGIGSDGRQPFWVQIVVGATPTPIPITAWRGEYFTNRDLAGNAAIVRDDADVNFNWNTSSPATAIPADGFSARWTRSLNFAAGTYRFSAHSDDGVRIWLNGELIIDQWHAAINTTYSVDRTLSAATYSLRVEYYENRGDAHIQFWWERAGDFPQWRADYFANTNLSGAATVTRNEGDVNFNWGAGSPASSVPVDNFSARWSRTLWFDEGAYRFHARVDDGVRVYIDGALFIDEWRDGVHDSAADVRVSTGNHNLRVEYYERGGNASIHVWWEKIGASYPEWKGEYWSNRDLSGNPNYVRNDASIDFNWGRGAPASNIPNDNFSVRWTRNENFDAASYRFHALVDDGVRVWVDDRLIVDEWRDGGTREVMSDATLSPGTHAVRIEYYERSGDARIRVWWEKIGASFPDWKGEFWNNIDLNGAPVYTANYSAIDFDWGENPPAPGVNRNRFSARWTRTQAFDPGVYRFTAQADDGIRVYANGQIVIDEWHGSSGDAIYRADIALAGQQQIVVEYFDGGNLAFLNLSWRRIGAYPSITPSATASHTPTASVTASVTPSATSTDAGDPPTATATPTATTTTTATPTATQSVEPPTATLTQTSEPPTSTPSATATQTSEPPTSTPSATATRTSESPTSTPSATATQTSESPTSTPSATASPTQTSEPPTATATQPSPSGVRLNEVLAAPGVVDWNGDGVVDGQDEWIEIANTGTTAVDLSGWALETDSGGRYAFAAGTRIESGQYRVFYAAQTGLALNDRGDGVRLIDSAALVVDRVSFTVAALDRSFSRDEGDGWHSDWPPSPGASNQAVATSLEQNSTALRTRSLETTTLGALQQIVAFIMEMIQRLIR